MRKIVFILLLLLVTQLLVATNAFFAPYPSSFNVDLSDTVTYSGVSVPIGFVDGFAPGYSDQTMIALLGFSSIEVTGELEWGWDGILYVPKFVPDPHKIELKVEVMSSKGFEYVSASEPYLSRPFELDIVENYNDGETKRYKLGMSGSGKVATYTAESISTDEVWFDIVLSLPEDGLSNALAKSDYYVELKITATEYNDDDRDGNYEFVSEHGPWPFYISGYIDEGSPANVSYVMMNIIPTASANAISIDQLADGVSIHIADYFYESMAFMPGSQTDIFDEGGLGYRDQKENPLYVFASSSSDPTVDSAGVFTMKMAGFEDEDNLSSAFSFQYEIVMENVDGISKDFDGTTPESTDDMLQGSYKDGTTGDQHSKEFEVEEGRGTRKETEYGVKYYYDDGKIYIKLPKNYDTTKLDNLTAGVYTSSIYIHVVSAN